VCALAVDIKNVEAPIEQIKIAAIKVAVSLLFVFIILSLFFWLFAHNALEQQMLTGC